jgi:pyranose oxidase
MHDSNANSNSGGQLHDDIPVVDTDVLVIGSGPTGATYARKLVDAGVRVYMVEIGAQETLVPGDHKKNNYLVQKELNNFISVVRGELDLLSVPSDKQLVSYGDPSSWSIDPAGGTIFNGQNPCQDAYVNLPAASATRNVGGMSSHWTCCTPRQHPKLERSNLFNDAEWESLYKEAEERITTNSTLYNDSIRQQLVQKTLEQYEYGRGPREFIPMPLAAQRLPDQSYLEWSSSATVFGDITQAPGRRGNENFTLRSQVRCTRLIRSGCSIGLPGVGGHVEGALCKDLKTKRSFLVRAKKYVLCAGAVLTPGIMFNSGWDDSANGLPALGKYLTEQTMAFCQVLLSRDLVNLVKKDPYGLGWKTKVEKHHRRFPEDPLPIPFNDPDPQVYTPVSENYPWHTQIHRDAFSYGQVPATVDQRLIVDLRWFGWVTPVKSNCVTFSKTVTDQYHMPQPTFHYQVPEEDARRSHAMMDDMCRVAGKLGGFLPGAEPRFLVPGSALHISGTTRAGTHRDDSVCDKYGRVWDTDNVVVGGCGVIPTGAACNPTLTAMCFAIAGADKIIEELGPGSAARQ